MNEKGGNTKHLFKTDLRTISISTLPLQRKMRSPDNAAWDVIHELGMEFTVRETVVRDAEDPRRWLITFESVPGTMIYSKLFVEVLETEGHPVGCVLQRKNCGRIAMTRIMNKLMDRLERPRSGQPLERQPWEAPPPSPPLPDRHGPPGDDIGYSTPPRRNTRRS